MRINNSIKHTLIDLCYSFVAYILPTFILQIVIFPLIAGKLSPDQNGLFLALFNAVRLCVSLFIIPLSNVRLLKKKECFSEPSQDKSYNFLFVTVTLLSTVIVVAFGILYYKNLFTPYDMIRLVAVLILLSAHDYYIINFRINISYKDILIDNVLIVVGYIIGILLMLRFGYWELIFICGYSLGLAYTMMKSKLWRAGIRIGIKREVLSEYGQLSLSSGLNNATTYCDKMLIYPLIGGYSVSVYNAAAVVSKMMSLVSVPLRNVFLSYIVDADKPSMPKVKSKKLLLFAGLGTLLLYGGFYVASILICRILYPQYFAAALKYIPLILLAILFETYSGLIKVYLLRFEKTMVQLIISFSKVFLYLLCVMILNVVFSGGLLGFCLSILIADFVQFVITIFYFIKSFNTKAEGNNYVS